MIRFEKDMPIGFHYFYCICELGNSAFVASIITPNDSVENGGALDAVASLYRKLANKDD